MSHDVVHPRKKNIAALPLYHSGQLLKKNNDKKEFKSFHAELRGTTLFLFKIDAQENFTEKLNLEKLTSKDLPCPYMSLAPTIFTLNFKSAVVQLKMDDPAKGEKWRAYLLTLTEKKISRKLMLPQSEIMMLEDALEREKKRYSPTAGTDSPPKQDEDVGYSHLRMPECFIDVTRMEAEKMLEVCPENGSLIIRPSKCSGKNYAVTMRLEKPSGPVMQHFRVTPKNNSFVIEVAPPVEVKTLEDVVDYFCQETHHEAQPYGTSIYSNSISLRGMAQNSTPSAASNTVPTEPKTFPRNHEPFPTYLKTFPIAQVSPVQLQEPQPFEDNPVMHTYVTPDEVHSLHNELQRVLETRKETTDRGVRYGDRNSCL